MIIGKQGDIAQVDIYEKGVCNRVTVLVLSSTFYNMSGLMMVAPILYKTPSMIIQLPLISVDEKRVLLADQIRNINYRERNFELTGTVSGEVLMEALSVLKQIFDIK